MSLTRRTILRALGAATVAAVTRPAAGRAAEPALGAHEKVEDALRRLFGTRPLKDGAGIVKLEVPVIAENGALVPVAVDVASPMTPASHVKHIYIVADRNRIPVVSRISLGPGAALPQVSASIRLGENTDVRAIVEHGDGTLVQVKREVKVTVSGCGG